MIQAIILSTNSDDPNKYASRDTRELVVPTLFEDPTIDSIRSKQSPTKLTTATSLIRTKRHLTASTNSDNLRMKFQSQIGRFQFQIRLYFFKFYSVFNCIWQPKPLR